MRRDFNLFIAKRKLYLALLAMSSDLSIDDLAHLELLEKDKQVKDVPVDMFQGEKVPG